MRMRNLRLALTQCREALAKRLQKVSEPSGMQPALDRSEVVDIALTSLV